MIINYSYFKGEIYLPQVGANASSQVNDNELLRSYIDVYEGELLNKGLGRKLYKEFLLQLNEDGTLKESVDQKWSDLLNGAEYSKGNITYYWRGLIDSSESLISYYIYYYYVLGKVRKQTTLGTKLVESKNAVNISPTPEITRAWRKLHEWYQGGATRNPIRYEYRGVYVEDYFNGEDNSKDVSLFTFLSDNRVYDDWCFTPIENKNEWGL
jgi:hypothetical protein